MSESSKKAAGVGGGYNGRTGATGRPYSYITGGLSGQDGTGYNPIAKLSNVAQNVRKEISDTLKRRTVGFRGL